MEVQAIDPMGAGNGSLMRTGPVAFAHLGDTESLVKAARAMSALTHPNEYAMDVCVLWTLAIDHSIPTGELAGPRVGLGALHEDRQEEWRALIDDAETRVPRSFAPNGYVVWALQAAWAAIHATLDGDAHFAETLRTAVSIGDDTDTVAAIAGSLLGATYGIEVIPLAWRHDLAGGPREYREADLLRLAARAVAASR